MGSGLSTNEKKSAEGRCRQREHWMKECVKKQHAYAAAHAAYLRSLKDTGAAIRQFGEVVPAPPAEPGALPAAEPGALPVPSDAVMMSTSSRFGKLQRNPSNRRSLPYFPPPFPHFLLTPSSSSSTPTFFLKHHSPAAQKMHSLAKSFIPSLPRKLTFSEDTVVYSPPHALPPPLPMSISSHWEDDLYNNVFPPHQASSNNAGVKCEHDEDSNQGTPTIKGDRSARCDYEDRTPENADFGKRGMLEVSSSPSVNGSSKGDLTLDKIPSTEGYTLAHVLKKLDDCFMVAFESGRDVARLLEGQRTHYHQNPAGATGSLKHSSRVHRVMSWGRYMHADGEYALTNGEDDNVTSNNEKETHASTLDKLLAWEKKLHEEVKVGEVLRIQLEKKSMQLKKQKKREEGSAIVNKTKASVKSLHTRYLVEIQAVDAASNEVEKLRDNFLHSQLQELVQQSMRMWEIMLNCHQQQFLLVEDLRLDTSWAPVKTTESQVKNTLQLEGEFEIWQKNLEKLVITQKDYLHSVCEWLVLHFIEIEGDGKRVPASLKNANSPVYELAEAWFDALKRVNGDASLHAMKQFSNRIHELKLLQTEEIKQKKRLDQLKKQLEKKEHALKVQMVRQDENLSEDAMNTTGSSSAKAIEASIKLLKERVDFEKDKYEKMCAKSGNMTLGILQKGLTPVLKAMKDFANNFFHHYTNLSYLSVSDGGQMQNQAIPMLQITY